MTKMKSQTQHSYLSPHNPHNWEHLKPLSVYSKRVMCEQKPSPDQPRLFVNSFINLKTGVVNSSAKKRPLDYSSQDEGYETPAKKSFNPEVVSPDLGCYVSDCSPLGLLDSVSPFAVPSSLDKTHALRSGIKRTINSEHSEHADCGSSAEGGTKGTTPLSFKPEEVVLNLAPAFDCDIDDILCLNPLDTPSPNGLSEHAQGCKCRCSSRNNAVSLPTVAHGEAVGKGHERVGEGQLELNKEMQLRAEDGEPDKGYFSISFVKDLTTKNSPAQSGDPQLATQFAGSSFALNNLLALNDLYPLSSCTPPQSDVSESLDGEVEGIWDIGPPILQSSFCHNVTVTLSTTGDEKREVVEECLATHSIQETTSDTSYETTLPLQVQVRQLTFCELAQKVKSIVVIPNPPDERVSQGVQRASSQRLMLDREVDWESGKKNYVHAVTKHMTEKGKATQDVMSELLNLMTNIADQTSSRRTDAQWQHPSDLTRKNYQRRWGNTTPKWTLDEWQEKSVRAHKRFAKVPKIFQRSPFP